VGVMSQSSILEFFREMVGTAIARQQVEVSDDACHYLVTLLDVAVRNDGTGPGASMLDERPLAVRLAEALEHDAAGQSRALRDMADATLLLCGFFAERLEREPAPPRYYHALGGFAYRTLGVSGGPLSPTFCDLAMRFGVYADVLLEVGHRTELTRSGRLLRLYEHWQRRRHRVSERLLIEQGVVLPSGRRPSTVQ
jgi:hypothetical protein